MTSTVYRIEYEDANLGVQVYEESIEAPTQERLQAIADELDQTAWITCARKYVAKTSPSYWDAIDREVCAWTQEDIEHLNSVIT